MPFRRQLFVMVTYEFLQIFATDARMDTNVALFVKIRVSVAKKYFIYRAVNFLISSVSSSLYGFPSFLKMS